MLYLQQKIGQMMFVGFKTKNVNDITNLIKEYNFGNVILFSRNIDNAQQLKEMCAKIQEAALSANGIPAFIAVDQEGGSVRRIYKGITNTPGAMAIAAATGKYSNAAHTIGTIIGQELKDIGINFNLAPVVDVNSNPYNPIIAIRAFGDNPQKVSEVASDFAMGLQSEGVLACYKHFLGHGAVEVDSHIDLPRVKKEFGELDDFELVPYKNANIADSIMTAHVLFEKIDDKFPASISEIILNDLLRRRLKYSGLVVSDCFEMEGLIKTFSFDKAAHFAVKGGTDIITVSHTFGRQLSVRNALVKDVLDGVLDMQIIDTAVERILKYKNKYCKKAVTKPNYTRNAEIASHISANSVTVASGTPFEVDKNTVVIGVTNFINSIAEDQNAEKLEIAKIIGEEFNIKYKSIGNKTFNTNEILEFAKYKKVILALSDSHLTLVQRVLYSTLVQNNKVMLVSMRSPYDALNQPNPHCHVCVYEYTALSVQSLINFLKTNIANGVLPVNLNIPAVAENKKDIKNKNRLVQNCIAYININFAKKLTLDSVAEEFLISGYHLCKLVKKYSGKGFVDILHSARIDEAKKLLKTTHLKIYEVANICGYTDFNYFCRKFKKYVGTNPLNFRNNQSFFD